MATQLEEITRTIERRLETERWEVDGVNLLPVLMVEWLMKYSATAGERLQADLKAVLKMAGGEVSRLVRRPSALEVRSSVDLDRTTTRFLIGFGYPWEDMRHTGPLRSLLDALGDPSDVLGLTNQEDVFEGLRRQNVAAVFLRPPRLSVRPEVRGAPVPWRDRAALSRCLWLGEWVREFLDTHRPHAVVTCQDFHAFDQVLASSARSRNIPSLTHQHGMIPEGGSLFRILTSDRIALWGRRSAAKLADHLPPERLWVVGTDRFKHLLPRSDGPSRDRIVIALNPTGEEGTARMAREMITSLAAVWDDTFRDLRVVVKLHPSMDEALWEKRIRDVPAARSLPLEVIRNRADDFLHRTRFLVAHRSTITLDAAAAGAVVIEVEATAARSLCPAFFDTAPQAVVQAGEFGEVVARLLNDPVEETELRRVQHASLGEEIADHDAPATIARWLRSSAQANPPSPQAPVRQVSDQAQR